METPLDKPIRRHKNFCSLESVEKCFIQHETETWRRDDTSHVRDCEVSKQDPVRQVTELHGPTSENHASANVRKFVESWISQEKRSNLSCEFAKKSKLCVALILPALLSAFLPPSFAFLERLYKLPASVLIKYNIGGRLKQLWVHQRVIEIENLAKLTW